MRQRVHEIGIMDWYIGGYINASEVKIHDTIIIEGDIYIVEDIRYEKNYYSIFIENLYNDYNRRCLVKPSTHIIGKRVVMPSIILDAHTKECIKDIEKCLNIDSVEGEALIYSHFDEFAKKAGKHYDNIIYSNWILPIKNLKKVSTFHNTL